MPRSHCRLYFLVPSHMYSFAALMNTMQNKRHSFPRTLSNLFKSYYVNITIIKHATFVYILCYTVDLK